MEVARARQICPIKPGLFQFLDDEFFILDV